MGLTDRIRSLLGKVSKTPPEARSVDATLRDSGESTSSTAPTQRPLRKTLADVDRPVARREVETSANSGDEKGASLREQIRRTKEREAIGSSRGRDLEGRVAARVASVSEADAETDRLIFNAAIRRADELLAMRNNAGDPNEPAYKRSLARAEELERARQISDPGRRARIRSQFVERGAEAESEAFPSPKSGRSEPKKVPKGMGFLVEEGLVEQPSAGDRARIRKESSKQTELMPGRPSAFKYPRGRHTPDQMADLAMRLIDAGVPEHRAADATFELLDAISQTHTYRDPGYLSDPDSAVLKPGVLQPGERKLTVPSATESLNQAGAKRDLPRQIVGSSEDSWVNQQAQQQRVFADNIGLTDKIGRLFAKGFTAKEVQRAFKRDMDALGLDSRDQELLVVSVRGTLGIPSRATAEGAAEFEAWKKTNGLGDQQPSDSVPVSPLASDDDVDQAFNRILEKYNARSRLPSQEEMNATLESTLRDDPIQEGPVNQGGQFGRPDNPLKGLMDDPEDMSPESLSDYQYSSDFLKTLQQLSSRNKITGSARAVGPLERHVAAVREAMQFGDTSPAGKLRNLLLSRMTAEQGESGTASYRAASLPNRLQLKQLVGRDIDKAVADLAEQVGSEPSLEAIAPKLAESLQMNMEATKGRFVESRLNSPGRFIDNQQRIKTLAESGQRYNPTAQPYEDAYREPDGSETRFPTVDEQGNPRYFPQPEISEEPFSSSAPAARKSIRESLSSLLNDVRSGLRETFSDAPERTDAAPQGPRPGDPITESRKGLFIDVGGGERRELLKLERRGNTSQTKKQLQDWKAYLPLDDGRFLEYTASGSDGTVATREDIQRMVNSGYEVAPNNAAGVEAFTRDASFTREEAYRSGRILREYYSGGGNAADVASAIEYIDRLDGPTAPAGLRDVAFEGMGLSQKEAVEALTEIRKNVDQIKEAAGGAWTQKGASVDGPPIPSFKDTPEGVEVRRILQERRDRGDIVDPATEGQAVREVLLRSFNASAEETADPARATRNVLNRLDAQGIPLGNDTLIHQLAAFANISPDEVPAPRDDLEKLEYAAMLRHAYASAPQESVDRVLELEGKAARSWSRAFGGASRRASPMSENLSEPAPSPDEARRMLEADAEAEGDAAARERFFLDAMKPENLEDGRFGVQPSKDRQAPPRPTPGAAREKHLNAIRALFGTVDEVNADGSVSTTRNPVPLGFQVAEGRFQQRVSGGAFDAVRAVDLNDPELAIGSMQSEIDTLRESIASKMQLPKERADQIAGDIQQDYDRRALGADDGSRKVSPAQLRKLKKKMFAETEKALSEERLAMADEMIASGESSDPDVAKLKGLQQKLADFQESLSRVTGADYKSRTTARDAQTSLMERLFDSAGVDRQSEAGLGNVEGEMLPGQRELVNKQNRRTDPWKDGDRSRVSKLPKEPMSRSMDRAEFADIVERLYGGKYGASDNIKAVAAEMHRRGIIESPEDYESVIYDSLARNGSIANSFSESALRDAAWQITDHLGLKKTEAPDRFANRVTDETIARGRERLGLKDQAPPQAPRRSLLQRLLGQQPPEAPQPEPAQDFSGLVSEMEASVPEWSRRLAPFDATKPRQAFEDLGDLPEPAGPTQLQEEHARLLRLATSLESQLGGNAELESQFGDRVRELVRRIRNDEIPAIEAARHRVGTDVKAQSAAAEAPAERLTSRLAPETQVPGAMFSPIVDAAEDIPGLPEDIEDLISQGAMPHFTSAAEARRLIEAQRGNVYDASTRSANLAQLDKNSEAIEALKAEMDEIRASARPGSERLLGLAKKDLDALQAQRSKLQSAAEVRVEPVGPFDPRSSFLIEDAGGASRFSASRAYGPPGEPSSMTSRYSAEMPRASTAEELAEIADDLDHVVLVGPDRRYARSYVADMLRSFAAENGADLGEIDQAAAGAGAALRSKVALANQGGGEMDLIRNLAGRMPVRLNRDGGVDVDSNAPLDQMLFDDVRDPRLKGLIDSLPEGTPEDRYIPLLVRLVADSPLDSLKSDHPMIAAARALAPRYEATTLRELSHAIGGHLSQQLGSIPTRQRIVGIYKGRPSLRSADADAAMEMDLAAEDAAMRETARPVGRAQPQPSPQARQPAPQPEPARADEAMGGIQDEDAPDPYWDPHVARERMAEADRQIAKARWLPPKASQAMPAAPEQGSAPPGRSRIRDLISRNKFYLGAAVGAGLGSYAARMNGEDDSYAAGQSDYMDAISEMASRAAAQYEADELASEPEMDTNKGMALAPVGAAGEEMLASAGTQAASPAAVLSRLADARRSRSPYLTTQNPFPY